MRKIADIYNEYKIMYDLQLHQMRVAAVAMQICDSLNIKIDKNMIKKAALIHDLGNIVKVDFNHFPEFFKSEGVEYWQKIKNQFVEKYGFIEHEATAKIVYEIGMPKRIIELVSKNIFSYLCLIKESDDWDLKILKYADMRVGPNGVLSYHERMKEAHERYKDKPDSVKEGGYKLLISCGEEIENQIFSNSNLKPEDINDNSIVSYMEGLKDFEI